jgi:hypothetical protein
VTEQPGRPGDVYRHLDEPVEPGDLDAILARIPRAAVEMLPHVQYASLTVRRHDGTLETVAPTDDILRDVEQAECKLQEGPCYEAATDTVHVVATDLAADDRWPRYGPVAVRHGIRSQAAIRLFDGSTGNGALNLYSTSVGEFARLESVGGLFRHHAAVALSYAYEIQNLREALETRQMIGQAVGIVMARYRMDEQRAFGFLTRISQERNVKLRDIARQLVEEYRADQE